MERAKAFFLICAGILLLTVALKIGTDSAWADYDPQAGGPVIGFSGNSYIALLENGEVWYREGGEWVRAAGLDPPIPISEIAFYEGNYFIATNGDFWLWDGNQWENGGAPPMDTEARTGSWSQLKSRFGK